MTHSAKKIGPSEYKYRGHNIEEVGQYGDTPNIAQWNITFPGDDHAEEATNTLRDAKAMIDRCLA